MTILKKIIGVTLFLFNINSVFSQKIDKNITYDIDSIPIYINFDSYKFTTDSIYYIKANRNLVKLICDIDFLGGIVKLNAFCDSLYYNRTDYNYQEMNQTIRYCIIFDENLHIKDIRILSRFHDMYDKIRYYIMFHNMLLRTEGLWQLKDNKTYTWHLYNGRYTFY